MITRPSMFSFVVLLALSVNADEFTDSVVDWVVSKGGFFSEKLEIRGMNPNDKTLSELGVFAKDDIEPQEPLIEVPHSCYIALWDKALPDDESDDKETNYYKNMCHLSQKLMTEMQKRNESDYAPYINYLWEQRRGQLPATWSKAGKDVLRAVLTPGSDVVDWIDTRFKGSCIRSDDAFGEHVVALTTQRGFDSALIPIWDMVDHRNGWVNIENDSIWAGDRLKVRASTKIYEGDEVYASYDECLDCGTVSDDWGTPEILRDFGFVEQYQQRWIFPEQNIWFAIDDWNDDDDDNNRPPMLKVEWDTEGKEAYGIPNKAGMTFLRNELQRLNSVVAEKVLKEQGDVPKHEWDIILQYHRDATIAISMAIESLESLNEQEL